MAYKINGTTVVDNSRNVCACCVTSCCITASDRMDIPSGTTACRPSSPATGSLYFDTDEGGLVAYDGTSWAKQGGGEERETLALAADGAWSVATFCTNFCFCECCLNNPCELVGDWLTGLVNQHTSFCGQNTCNCVLCYQSTDNLHGCRFSVHGLVGSKDYQCCCCTNYLGFDSLSKCSCAIYAGFAPQSDGSMYSVHGIKNYTQNILTQAFPSSNNRPEIIREAFWNNKGAFTQREQHFEQAYCCNCVRPIPFGTKPYPQYFSRTTGYGGPMPAIRNNLCYFATASKDFCRQTLFISTTETFGTRNVEVCCWAVSNRSSPRTCGVYWEQTGSPCIVARCDFYFGPGACLSGVGNSPFVYSCVRKMDCSCFLFTSQRTDVYGGGGVLTKDSFIKDGGTTADGMCIKEYDPNCCPLVILQYCGQRCNCACFARPGNTRIFPSADGCRIFFASYNCASCSTTFCCCKIDTNGSCCCFGDMFRLRVDIVNRVEGCAQDQVGACCLCFVPWKCDIMGCVYGTDTLAGIDTPSASCFECMLCTDACRARPGNPSNIFNRAVVVCGYPVCAQNSWLSRSLVCPRLYYSLGNKCTNANQECPKVITWNDCCCFFTCGLYLSFRNVMCYMQFFALPPKCYNHSCVPGICYMPCLSDDKTFATVCACACSITGSENISLMARCLGYSVGDNNTNGWCCRRFFDPGNGFNDGNTFINPENDHLVMIRAFGVCFFCSGTQYRLSEVSWVGAICYDLTNCCVSKVNTLWPHADSLCHFYACCWSQHVACTSNNSYRIDRNDCLRGEFSNCCPRNCLTGLQLTHYGSEEIYKASNCVESGGVYVINDILGTTLCSSCCCESNRQPYFGCCCTGTNACICPRGRHGCNCGTNVCLTEQRTFSKLPYNKPFECIGWKDEPFWACIMNTILAPYHVDGVWGGMLTMGSSAHQCLATTMYGRSHFAFPTCILSAPYGSNDCCGGVCKSIKVFKGCCTVYSCCCSVHGGTNGTCCPVTLQTYLDYYNSCARSNVYVMDNIEPCHINRQNTSKRYVQDYLEAYGPMTNDLGPIEPGFYCGGAQRVDFKWSKLNEGENTSTRIKRWWDEDIIGYCCNFC